MRRLIQLVGSLERFEGVRRFDGRQQVGDEMTRLRETTRENATRKSRGLGVKTHERCETVRNMSKSDSLAGHSPEQP